MLDDIGIDALSVAVRGALAELEESAHHWNTNGAGWADQLKGWRADGMRAIDQRFVESEAVTLAFSRDVRVGIAALAMRPGGVRVCGIVFCATHHPAGTEARFRLSCPKCSPDDTMLTGAAPDPRDVVSIEGTI